MFMLIPAAGESRRFKEAGYLTPKPFLPVDMHDTQMIDAVAEKAPPNCKILMALQEEHCKYGEFLPDSVPIQQMTFLHKITSGQAETVDILASLVPNGAEVLVCNCDGVVPAAELAAFVLKCQLEHAHSGVLTTNSIDPALSYVKGYPLVEECAEKRVIGPDAVVGIYWFRHSASLRFAITRSSMVSNGERYLTPALVYTQPCLNVRLEDPSHWTSWGTPAEYEAYMKTKEVA